MTFRCEDLREHGLILVPNTSSEYDPLLEDIQRRIENPPAGMPPNLHRMFVGTMDPNKRFTSAVLLNQSGKSIVSLEVVWRNEHADGRVTTNRRSWNDVVGMRPSSPMHYWHHILPGSKRYIGEDRMVGDNSDVRPPTPEEVPRGGGFEGVEALIGTIGRPPSVRDLRAHEVWSCARRIARYREALGDEAAMERLISYTTNELPQLRRI